MKYYLQKFSIFILGMGISALISGFLFFGLDSGKKTSKELAAIELDLRKSMQKFNADYKVKVGLIRNSDSITLRIWDKGMFPINDWRLSRNGETFVKDLALALGKIDQESEIKIDSHYDSVNPIKKGNTELNKIKISNYRAAQVANMFTHKGFDPERISYRGLSDKAPIVKDRDVFGNYIAEAGSMNRRVEITITAFGGKL